MADEQTAPRQNPLGPGARRVPRAAANEAPSKPAELTPAAKAALASAARAKPAPVLGVKEKTDAVAALLAGANGAASAPGAGPVRRRNVAADGEPVGRQLAGAGELDGGDGAAEPGQLRSKPPASEPIQDDEPGHDGQEAQDENDHDATPDGESTLSLDDLAEAAGLTRA